MANQTTSETYYQILGVSSHASTTEIANAYQLAKNAFAKDSLATYSLMPQEDSLTILAQLETAYLTLTNPDKRRVYDKSLVSGETSPTQNSPASYSEPTTKIEPMAPADPSPSEPTVPLLTDSNNLNLSAIRESHGLTLNDVSRITKIPLRYLKAIEEFNPKDLPARVYVQGFVKNLAQLYRLDPKKAVSLYLDRLEQVTGPNPN
jgi:curved DNA-binding protein CbpA